MSRTLPRRPRSGHQPATQRAAAARSSGHVRGDPPLARGNHEAGRWRGTVPARNDQDGQSRSPVSEEGPPRGPARNCASAHRDGNDDLAAPRHRGIPRLPPAVPRPGDPRCRLCRSGRVLDRRCRATPSQRIVPVWQANGPPIAEPAAGRPLARCELDPLSPPLAAAAGTSPDRDGWSVLVGPNTGHAVGWPFPGTKPVHHGRHAGSRYG
jgi:hypothetical protein